MLSNKIQHHVFLFVVVCFGPSSVLSASCANGELNTCLEGMNSFSVSDVPKTCKYLTSTEECLRNLESSCEMTDAQKNSKERTIELITSMKHTCHTTKDKCRSQAQKCMDPYDKTQKDTREAAKLCPVMQKTSLCLKKLVAGCVKESTTVDLESVINGVASAGKSHKCKEEGYAITGHTGKGISLRPTFSIFLSSAMLVTVFIYRVEKMM